MANHEKHLANHRSGQQRLNKAAVFHVPASSQKLDARLPTEQMGALMANLRIIEMRIAKAAKAGNMAKADALILLRDRQRGHIQRVSEEVTKQWARDDKWLASNADKGTILAQPRYRNGKERAEALALATSK